ncbi:uncharacterized protein SCHCODRAFT_02673968 [Schizophyllum commune H4-8]|uniref:uncharacterized protein n=1 Tax=Schizophyllum commune (strain H4-8 / FGSC 9210) TaxID=578458 RepID=UPI00215DE5D0|nr:uncharacterized protein SCHCODRAFT_02673968 [Schizophyllum commune H4-8]KAI5884972.1 hypothetical protein SCHCODRAFT_02673968 [Schizophyllum commune H4-8]
MRVERVTHRTRAWISWAHATASDALSMVRGHLHALHLRHARRAAPHARSHAWGASHHPAGAGHAPGATHAHHAAPQSVACWTERAARAQTARKHRAAAARHSRGAGERLRVVRWMTGALEAGRAVRGCASTSSSPASRYAV